MQSTNPPAIPPKSRKRKRPLQNFVGVIEGHVLANETQSNNDIKPTQRLLLRCLGLFEETCGKCCNLGKCGNLTPDVSSLIGETARQAIKANLVDRFFICLTVLAYHLPDAKLEDVWAEHDWIPADIKYIISSLITHLVSLGSNLPKETLPKETLAKKTLPKEVQLYIENTRGFLDKDHMPEGEVLSIYDQILSWTSRNTRSRNLKIPSSIIEPKDRQRRLAVFRLQVEYMLRNFISIQMADEIEPLTLPQNKRYRTHGEVKELKNDELECALATEARIYSETAGRMEITTDLSEKDVLIPGSGEHTSPAATSEGHETPKSPSTISLEPYLSKLPIDKAMVLGAPKQSSVPVPSSIANAKKVQVTHPNSIIEPQRAQIETLSVELSPSDGRSASVSSDSSTQYPRPKISVENNTIGLLENGILSLQTDISGIKARTVKLSADLKHLTEKLERSDQVILETQDALNNAEKRAGQEINNQFRILEGHQLEAKAENEKLEIQLRSYQQGVEQLGLQLNTTCKEFSNLSTCSEELKSFQQATGSFLERQEEISGKLAAFSQRMDQVEKTIAQAMESGDHTNKATEEEQKHTSSKLIHLQSQLDLFEKCLFEHGETNIDQQAAQGRMQGRIGKIQQQVLHHDSKISDWEKKEAGLQKQISSVASYLSSQRQVEGDLKAKQDKIIQEVASLEERIKTSDLSNGSLSDSFQQLSTRLDTAFEDQTEMQNRMKAVDERLERVKDANSNTQAEIVEVKKGFQGIETKVGNLDDLAAKWEPMRTSVSELQAKFPSLEKRLDQMDITANEQRSQVDSLVKVQALQAAHQEAERERHEEEERSQKRWQAEVISLHTKVERLETLTSKCESRDRDLDVIRKNRTVIEDQERLAHDVTGVKEDQKRFARDMMGVKAALAEHQAAESVRQGKRDNLQQEIDQLRTLLISRGEEESKLKTRQDNFSNQLDDLKAKLAAKGTGSRHIDESRLVTPSQHNGVLHSDLTGGANSLKRAHSSLERSASTQEPTRGADKIASSNNDVRLQSPILSDRIGTWEILPSGSPSKRQKEDITFHIGHAPHGQRSTCQAARTSAMPDATSSKREPRITPASSEKIVVSPPRELPQVIQQSQSNNNRKRRCPDEPRTVGSQSAASLETGRCPPRHDVNASAAEPGAHVDGTALASSGLAKEGDEREHSAEQLQGHITAMTADFAGERANWEQIINWYKAYAETHMRRFDESHELFKAWKQQVRDLLRENTELKVENFKRQEEDAGRWHRDASAVVKFSQPQNKNTQLEKEVTQLQTQVLHLQRVSEEQQHHRRRPDKTLGLGSPVHKATCDATSVPTRKRHAEQRIQQTPQHGGVNDGVKNAFEPKSSRQNHKGSMTLRSTQVRTKRICDPNVKKTNTEKVSPQKYILKDVAPSTKNVHFIDPHGKILRVALDKVVALDHEGLIDRLRSLWQDNKTQRSLPLSLCVASLSTVPEGGWKVAWIHEANRASDVFTELSSLVDLGWHILPQLESLPDHGQQYAPRFRDLFSRSFAEQNGEELEDFQAKFVNLDIGEKPGMR